MVCCFARAVMVVVFFSIIFWFNFWEVIPCRLSLRSLESPVIMALLVFPWQAPVFVCLEFMEATKEVQPQLSKSVFSCSKVSHLKWWGSFYIFYMTEQIEQRDLVEPVMHAPHCILSIWSFMVIQVTIMYNILYWLYIYILISWFHAVLVVVKLQWAMNALFVGRFAQEECDILSLTLTRYLNPINFAEFKVVLLFVSTWAEGNFSGWWFQILFISTLTWGGDPILPKIFQVWNRNR